MVDDGSVLARAHGLVRGARQGAYGHPLDNHERIARLFTARLHEKLLPGEVILPADVTALMRLVKEARLIATPGHEDSLVDIAGYADCEQEMALETARRARVDQVVEQVPA